ncbi:MAG: hypothetical protein LLG00_16820 [Planctomycetaceae bacterium]|nr:hypothetical protein [Planctomycetaceae bacterium]
MKPTIADVPGGPPSSDSPRPAPTHPTADPATATPVTPTPKPEDIAAAKMRWLELQRQIESIKETLNTTNTDVDVLTSLLKQLPESESGKRIAASIPHLDQYRALLQDPDRKPVRLVSQHQDTVNVHLDTVRTYLGRGDNTALPNPQLVQDLERIEKEIKTLAPKYHRDRLTLENLVSETMATAPASTTLEKAVEQREREVAAGYAKQLAETRATADKEAQRVLREAEEKAIKEEAEAKAAAAARLAKEKVEKVRKDTDQQIAVLRDEEARKKREEETKRLRTLAEDPNVQAKYSALLRKGYMTFKGTPGAPQDMGQRPAPASFGDLNSRGWLKSVETFARAMSRQPSPDYNVFNDRPTLAFPKTPAEWEEMEELYEQFKVLGPIWVEMKLLEP